MACVEHLTSLPGVNVRLASNEGVTPLMVAAQSGHTNAVKALLTSYDSDDVMHQSDDGATVYHMAASTYMYHVHGCKYIS